MTEVWAKRPRFSNRAKTIIAIAVIALAVVLAFFAPPEGDASNTTGDVVATPTLVITNMIETASPQRMTTLNGMNITVTKVTEATKFSDDRKRNGIYTLRVQVLAHNSETQMLGLDYASLVRLQLPDGTMVVPKYISVKPVSLPKSTQSGYFDFPLSAQVPLSSLTLHLGAESTMSLSA